ncbi:ABC transporter substrate-binding protein [Novipirellula artificiosorum]|uniref:Glutathione-binding protein GsiB n=1 Tax=Novipirellula artificiosorum TaxID=2528016 RepID=A0A5C6DGS8_9BACT|nr:ABC transporter substrate-binding protein [Novipirellula artificiosorum]TWU34286.1 Glutathione-binding protein GsiB precursor [Novipirellula artificiosorum]
MSFHSVLHSTAIRLLGVCLLSVFAARLDAQENPQRIEPIKLKPDDAPRRGLSKVVAGSHVKVFIPSLPYLYTSHSINGALIKPSDHDQGWEYDMAVSHQQIDETTYEFKLRQGVKFQDGSPFNADAVVMNMDAFKEQPVTYSKINQVFDFAEKIDDETVRFHLTEKYGCFMNDLIWMQFYTKEYLDLNGGWNGKASCPNLSRAGPYGLGPYELTEGYIEGDRHSPKAVLKANPYYWDPSYPKVETITVYTQLDTLRAKNAALYEEGMVDIASIPPEHKVETILSPHAKLVVSPSNDNIAIHINMINGNPRLRETAVRRALNEALHQQNLLVFAFEREGVLSPTLASPHFPGVREVAEKLRPYSEVESPYSQRKRAELQRILQGLRLKVLTQDRFLSMWRGIETQLGYVGVTLDVKVVLSEKEIFEPLLSTNAGQNEEQWDLLVWGNDDWFFNHPFTAFFVYRTHNVWSTVYPDSIMDEYIEEMFRASVGTPEFVDISRKIMRRAYDEAYMLFVPTPHKVFAVNKEVVFRPYKMACFPLWKVQVTPDHWSLRKGTMDESMKQPVQITRIQVKEGGS